MARFCDLCTRKQTICWSQPSIFFCLRAKRPRWESGESCPIPARTLTSLSPAPQSTATACSRARTRPHLGMGVVFLWIQCCEFPLKLRRVWRKIRDASILQEKTTDTLQCHALISRMAAHITKSVYSDHACQWAMLRSGKKSTTCEIVCNVSECTLSNGGHARHEPCHTTVTCIDY